MDETFSARFAGESLGVLEAVLAHSRDGITLVNSRGELEYLSPSASDALGLSRIDEARGKVWRDMWPEPARSAVDNALAAAWAGESARFSKTTGEGDETRYWDVVVAPVRRPDGAITLALAVSSEVTAQRAIAVQGQERVDQAESRASMAGVVSRELRHRLKNQLAVVNAVAKLLARHSDGAAELTHKLELKLIAMGRAHDLIMEDNGGALTAADAIRQVVAASGAGDRVRVDAMPSVEVSEETVQHLALLLGELQTNALKYGALREAGGMVTLTGAADGPVLSLQWQEDCERAIEPVDGGHGGFQLIRRLGAAGGRQPAIAWTSRGIAVTMHFRTIA